MLCLLLLFFSVVPYSLGSNAGFKFRITSQGLNYASETLVDLLRQRLIEASIKDVRGEHGDFKYEIKNIKAEPIPKALSRIELRADVIKVVLGGIDLTMSADWSYNFRKNRFIRISDSGSLVVRTHGLSINVEVSFEFDPTSKIPSIKPHYCQLDLNDLQFETFGKASLLYNTLFSLARGPLSEIIKGELCEAVNKAIDKNINKELAHLSMQIPLNSNLFLDYQLTSVPDIQTEWIEFSHSGTVFGSSVPKESLPDDQPSFCEMDDKKMVHGVLTEDFVNSYLKAFQLTGEMRKVLTRNDLTASEKGMLDTDCKSMLCLVKWITKTVKNIKNASLEISFEVTTIPTIKITEYNMSGHLSSKADIFVRYPDNSAKKLFTILLNSVVSGTLAMEKGLLRYALDVVDQKVEVEDDMENEANVKGIEVAEKMLRKKLLQSLNLKGKEGIPIPDARKFAWLETNIELKQRAVCFNTDLRYGSIN